MPLHFLWVQCLAPTRSVTYHRFSGLFIHFQTSEWIKSSVVLKFALEPSFSPMVSPSCVLFWLKYWWCVCTHTCAGVFPFCFFPSTVSTQSQHLWDYQSPFVFRREPSWLEWSLRWEPSGFYWKQPSLYLFCPLCIVSKSIYFKGRMESFFVCVWNLDSGVFLKKQDYENKFWLVRP